MSIGIILLAAGSSSRMGKSKQLLPVQGEPLLLRVVHTALHSKAKPVVVVLGSNEKGHHKIIEGLDVDVVINPTWQNGMGNSLKSGLNHLLTHHPSMQAVIIMVCDQPAITPEHLNVLVHTYTTNKKSIVASYYSNSPGVPVLMDKKMFAELLSIEDSYGAKKVIQAHLNEADLVSFDDGTIDLDTPEEYDAFIRKK